MGNITLAILVILTLIIYRAESLISNKDVLRQIEEKHLKVKCQMQSIVTDPYAVTKKTTIKWLSFLFILIAVLHFISISIFDANSENNLLNHKMILSSVGIIMVLSVGCFERRDLYKVIVLVTFVSFLVIYSIHSGATSIFGVELFTDKLHIGLFWKDALVILSSLLFLGAIYIVVLIARLISYIIYRGVRTIFKLSIHLSPDRPVKICLFIVEAVFALTVTIVQVL